MNDTFTISREFDAPRETVWKAWTNPEEMKQWWGPKGATIKQLKIDFRKGGTNHYCMDYMVGEMWGKFVYTNIEKPEKLEWLNSFSDKDGGTTRHPMAPTWPLQMETTATFTSIGNKTKITIKWVPHNPTEIEKSTFAAGMDSMHQGWTGTFDKFDEYIKSL